MIFRLLGSIVSRHWKLILMLWGLVFVICVGTAPPWRDVVRDGEFAYLPASAPSRLGEAEYRKAFSEDLLGSTAVIVVRRAGRTDGLLPQDRAFVEEVLKPAIIRIANSEGRLRGPIAYRESVHLPPKSIIQGVRTADDRILGRLLNSEDGKTTLVLIEFTTQFADRKNWRFLSEVETLIAQEGEQVGDPENLFARQLIPPGLALSLSGPATVGRDLRMSSETSTRTILQWAILLAVAGLLVFYRAPFLAMVPLLATAASVGMTMAAPAHLANAGWLEVFAGLDNYVLVVLAGAGLMSAMVFVARENETRFQSHTLEEAADSAIKRASPALAGGGVILLMGWGMLLFAQYGKLQQLGAALFLGGIFLLLSTLTFLPALMVLLGAGRIGPTCEPNAFLPTALGICPA